MTQNTSSRRRSKPAPQKQEGFWSGLISLMMKQCIFSAMIFAALYYIKNANLPFSEPVSAFIRDTVGFDMTIETIKSFTAGILG